MAVHYTGSKSPLGSTASLALSSRRLEDERSYHVNGHGWTDIAYLAAADVEGRVFDCRGIEYRCAANGDQAVNTLYGAFTFLLGVGDQPTPAMVEAFRVWRNEVWLKRWPHATKVVGHRDLYSTECPGDPLYALVRSGALTGVPQGDEDMPTADEIATATVNKWLAIEYGTRKIGEVLGQTATDAAAAARNTSPDALAAALAGHVDPAALATAIINQLGVGFAAAVADEFAKRLVR